MQGYELLSLSEYAQTLFCRAGCITFPRPVSCPCVFLTVRASHKYTCGFANSRGSGQ